MNTASAPTTDETSLSARETVRALYADVRPHRWAVAPGLLCALVGAAGGLLRPPATKTLVDRLDEATSQLDAVNERGLRDVVTDVARETTVLVVAHRMSTVPGADRIVVREARRVRAVGAHEQLVARDRLYAQPAATRFLAPAR